MSKKKKTASIDKQEIDEFECRIKEVTKEEFEIYRVVKEEGIIPLYQISKIVKETGLSGEKIMIICDNYSRLDRKYDKKFININKTKKKNK